MKSIEQILKQYLDSEIKFSVCSQEHTRYDTETKSQLNKAHITHAFYMYYLVEGSSQHQIDLKSYELSVGDMALVFPNQVHFHNKETSQARYFELFIEEQKQFVLNKQFSFLSNPLNKNLISLSAKARESISFLLQKLLELSHTKQASESLPLAYLNVLLEEINLAYFRSFGEKGILPKKDIEIMIAFKQFILRNLSEQFSIQKIALELGVSTNYLYKIVKKHTGKSPLEFIRCLLMDEAKRQLFYSNISIKELAYKLGYSDPAYFSRVFRQTIGKSAQAFRQDLSSK